MIQNKIKNIIKAKTDGEQTDTIPTISDLYPHLNADQLEEVEETLNRYLEVVLEIFDDFNNNLNGQDDSL